MAPSLDIEARVQEHAKFFNRLVGLIPAKFYLPETDEQTSDRYNKYLQNKSGKAPKQAIKERVRTAKKIKLDPDEQKSVLEIQSDIAKKISDGHADASDDESDDGENENDSDDDSDDADELPHKERPSAPPTWPDKFSAKSASITELREKLHARLEALRGKRKAPAVVGGADAKADGKRRLDKGTNKKKRAREEKEKKSLVKANSIDDGPAAKRPRTDASGPVVNEKGEVVFSKFDFGKAADVKKKKKGKDVKSLLVQAEKEKEKIEKLKATDEEKAKEVLAKKAWRKAMDMAEGVKVKDDTTLLKKTLKKKEKEKKRSEKVWKERKDSVAQTVAKRQEDRTKHLQERIQQKKDKRLGKKAPKSKASPGKKRAGFEGKKTKFAKKK